MPTSFKGGHSISTLHAAVRYIHVTLVGHLTKFKVCSNLTRPTSQFRTTLDLRMKSTFRMSAS